MSLAAWMPSSLRFFSICLLRALEALSSADMAQPILLKRSILAGGWGGWVGLEKGQLKRREGVTRSGTKKGGCGAMPASPPPPPSSSSSFLPRYPWLILLPPPPSASSSFFLPLLLRLSLASLCGGLAAAVAVAAVAAAAVVMTLVVMLAAFAVARWRWLMLAAAAA